MRSVSCNILLRLVSRVNIPGALRTFRPQLPSWFVAGLLKAVTSNHIAALGLDSDEEATQLGRFWLLKLKVEFEFVRGSTGNPDCIARNHEASHPPAIPFRMRDESPKRRPRPKGSSYTPVEVMRWRVSKVDGPYSRCRL